MNELENFKLQLRRFAEERDWEQFHSPKNLAMALSVEISEVVEHFQWLTEEQSRNLPHDKLEDVATELADTFIYLIRLADQLNIDLLAAVQNKLEINQQKYPVDQAKGIAKKYTEFEK
jgi:NTP pyrophosphatase (non-canonical NTP hydrolase)